MDKTTTDRVRRATGFFRELIDIAEIQGWSFRAKDEGMLFFPSSDKCRPGLDRVYAFDPGNQSHAQKHIRDRFRKAGLVFPDELKPERKPKQTITVNTTACTPSPPPNAFAQIRQKINATVTLLSEIEQLLVKIEADSAKVNSIKELLQGLAT